MSQKSWCRKKVNNYGCCVWGSKCTATTIVVVRVRWRVRKSRKRVARVNLKTISRSKRQKLLWYNHLRDPARKHVRGIACVSYDADLGPGRPKDSYNTDRPKWDYVLYGYYATFGNPNVIVLSLRYNYPEKKAACYKWTQTQGTTHLPSRYPSLITCDQKPLWSGRTELFQWKTNATKGRSQNLSTHARTWC